MLLNGLEHCRQSQGTVTRLLWHPDRGTLTVRNMLLGNTASGDGRLVTDSELKRLLGDGHVRTLVWESWDWGDTLPVGLERYHIFPALTAVRAPAPRRLSALIWRAVHPEGEALEAHANTDHVV